ncbi:regulator of G protein signaling domain protein [Teladorsagia circumcincta]|uniref:Regulator of G protein signaling domain protein n=1 Tax=Teladorsagia circumcincta TaxID=45464 RepID=A0A2G9UHK1_TELCI|nr:regulator of G protein signaling domain protein [Teladorsagia circumcincta]
MEVVAVVAVVAEPWRRRFSSPALISHSAATESTSRSPNGSFGGEYLREVIENDSDYLSENTSDSGGPPAQERRRLATQDFLSPDANYNVHKSVDPSSPVLLPRISTVPLLCALAGRRPLRMQTNGHENIITDNGKLNCCTVLFEGVLCGRSPILPQTKPTSLISFGFPPCVNGVMGSGRRHDGGNVMNVRPTCVLTKNKGIFPSLTSVNVIFKGYKINGCTLFREFLKKEFSDENVDFWLECEEFKKMKEGKKATIQRAHEIFKEYVAAAAPKEVC